MQHPMTMAVLDSLHQLRHELLHNIRAQTQRLQMHASSFWQSLPTTTLAYRQSFHVLLQIEIEEFKDRYSLWPSAWTILSRRTMLGSFISLRREIRG